MSLESSSGQVSDRRETVLACITVSNSWPEAKDCTGPQSLRISGELVEKEAKRHFGAKKLMVSPFGRRPNAPQLLTSLSIRAEFGFGPSSEVLFRPATPNMAWPQPKTVLMPKWPTS